MSERAYGAIDVVGKAAGMNQAGWAGAIDNAECTMLYNMGTTLDGEWKKRQGYELQDSLEVPVTTPPTLKLHWHTDTATDQVTGAGWVQTGDEVTAASSGALDVGNISATSGGFVILDGEETDSLYATSASADCFVKIPSSFNFDAASGRLKFFFVPDKSGGTVIVSTSSEPPDVDVYLFYGSASFNIYINTSGDIIWTYGSGLTINAGPVMTDTWSSIDIRWDNEAVNATYPYRFQIFINGVSKGYADPTDAVTMSLDASVYFLNTGSAGVSSPVYKNWDSLGTSGRTRLALISSWSASGASPIPNPSITGIHNNSSQQRAIITAGVSTPACGQLFYSPDWTLATVAASALAGVRTSATECQGNIYITDGTANMFYLIGTGTTTTIKVLPETAKWIEEYHGHLCIAGLGTNGAYSVRLSTIDDFVNDDATSWPATNQVFKCRDVVRGIKAYGGNLIVGTRTTIEAISGYLPHDFAKTIVANAGCASHWSMKEVPMLDGSTSALIWAGYDGIYMLISNQVTKISWPLQDFWDTLSKTEIEEAHAVDCRERGEYMLAVSDGSGTENNYVIVYNYRKGHWYIRKYAHRMDVLGKYYRSGREVILGGDSSGNLYELNLNDNDNGAAINAYMLTKWHDGGVPDQDKDFRKLYVWASPLQNYDIEVGWSLDYAEDTVEASVVAGTDGNDYVCLTAHEPSVVAGDDGNDYYCVDAHTSTKLFKPGLKAWVAEHTYALGDHVYHSDSGIHMFEVTTASGASGTSEPSWDHTHVNDTTADESIVWTYLGLNTSTSYWTSLGTTGRGVTWAVDTAYVSNDDKQPITGGQYASYWLAKGTIGEGSTWSASAGYVPESISMETVDAIELSAALPLFGTAVFGVDKFASTATAKMFAVDLTNARGKAIRFMFKNANADEPFAIHGYKCWFTYVPEFPA